MSDYTMDFTVGCFSRSFLGCFQPHESLMISFEKLNREIDNSKFVPLQLLAILQEIFPGMFL